LSQAAEIPYDGGEAWQFSDKTRHWFNHLLINTDGSRLWFLHRWTNGGGWATRAFTINRDGSNPYILDPHGRTSHFIWRDPQHVTAWSWHPSHKDAFYLYKDLTDIVEPVGLGVMNQNGHNTYLPNAQNEWILNDTYPDKNRLQHPYLYHVPTDRKVPLGHFPSPAEYKGEWRCDTHPRASRDGQQVCIDSPHNEGRQLYLIDISSLT
jgi:Tol biopolymer transport system component